jgi:enterochelin esterase-like enzyme
VTHPDRFGVVGIFSPAYWAADNYMTSRIIPQGSPRVFLSMGTAESSTGESSSNIYWSDAVNSYTRYISSGRAMNRDLVFAGVAGGQHNEPAWSRLLPTFYAFALDPWREANPLALELFHPQLAFENFTQNSATLRHLALFGFRHILQESPDLSSWTPSPATAASDFWEEKTILVAPSGQKRFWRLQTSAP